MQLGGGGRQRWRRRGALAADRWIESKSSDVARGARAAAAVAMRRGGGLPKDVHILVCPPPRIGIYWYILVYTIYY